MPRPIPIMAPGAYKTYSISAPTSTHFRKATCAEVDCPHYLNGWRTRVEILDAKLLHAAKNSGRHYTELRVAPGETYLVFEAGQACFQESNHRTRLEREELFVVKNGDWRRSSVVRQHTNAADWQDDFANHQDKLADVQRQG